MSDTDSLAAFAATSATLVLHLAITAICVLMDELAQTHGWDCSVVVVIEFLR